MLGRQVAGFISGVLGGLFLARAAGAQMPVGTELQVNAYTTDHQSLPTVAMQPGGEFVVVWQSWLNQDGDAYGVFGRRVSSAGVPVGADFQVNAFTVGYQGEPVTAASASGDFVVAWQQNAGLGYDVVARRFSSSGAPVGSELQVNVHTTGNQNFAAIAVASDGDFVVAWESYPQDGSTFGVFARRFSSAGEPQGEELQVNTQTAGGQRRPSIASGSDGDFVVVWEGDEDGSTYGVFGRRFSSAGAPLGTTFQVNTYTTGTQRDAAVAIDDAGAFVVAWTSVGQDGSEGGVFARRFSSAGAPLTAELQVNAFTADQQDVPAVLALAGGDFVVAWQSYEQDGEDEGVFARRFSGMGAGLSPELQVNSHTSFHQVHPSAAAEDDGDFVVVWGSNNQDDSGYGVFAQRFASTAVVELDVDGNGSLSALTDGLLVLRRFFNLGGTALTGGVVAANCTRCDAAAIEPYIAGLGLALDVDGNGSLQALTDGLLVVRYLFNLRGTALTAGAVGAGCTRCDAAAIEPYLANLVA